MCATFLRDLRQSGVADEFVVAGKKANVELISALVPGVRVVEIPFPASTGGDSSLLGLFRWIVSGLRLRSYRFRFGINFFPDVRERLFYRLAGCREVAELEYPHNHSMVQSCRWPGWFPFKSKLIEVPVAENIYDTYRRAATKVVGRSIFQARPPEGTNRTESLKIGLNVRAGQKCKEWEVGKWMEVAQGLLKRGYQVCVFGSQSDESALRGEFARLLGLPRFEVVGCGIRPMIQLVREIDVLVSLDSFAAHLARFVGTPSVTIFGPSDSVVWRATEAVVGAGHLCPVYPCNNSPRCLGTAAQYICTRAITVESVMGELERMLKSRCSRCR
jgi:ADP-heptose:LPS heptosyltransferase